MKRLLGLLVIGMSLMFVGCGVDSVARDIQPQVHQMARDEWDQPMRIVTPLQLERVTGASGVYRGTIYMEYRFTPDAEPIVVRYLVSLNGRGLFGGGLIEVRVCEEYFIEMILRQLESFQG
jgi:hypothetical protein